MKAEETRWQRRK